MISASRRTDIPRYFARWFVERRRAGFAEYRNAFGVSGRASLATRDVLAYLFWTRYALPFADPLTALREEGVPHAFQYTIAGHCRDVEPHVPETERALDDFLRTSVALPSPACIEWRYDPIVLSDRYTHGWHLRRFARIAERLQGATRVVNTSIVEPYRKALRRLADPTTRFRRVDPTRHRAVARQHPDLPVADTSALLADLRVVAVEHGMELRACCDAELGLPPSQCIAPELLAPWGEQVAAMVRAQRPAPSRTSCRCVRAVDIGMDETCLAGCKYCYVVSSHARAVEHFRRHDPRASALR